MLYAVSLTETAMAPGDVPASCSIPAATGVCRMSPAPALDTQCGREGVPLCQPSGGLQALQVFLKRYPARRIDVGIARSIWGGMVIASRQHGRPLTLHQS